MLESKSMFKFNFSTPSEPNGEQAQPSGEPAKPAIAADEVSADEARYVGLHDVVRIGEGVVLLKGHVSNAQAASLLGKLEVEDSDLLPGQYEGGFKVWEGSVDLAEYLAQLWQGGSVAHAASGASGSTDAVPGGPGAHPGASAATSDQQAGDPPGSPAAGGDNANNAGAGATAAAAVAAVARATQGGLAGRLAGQRVLELGCGHALPGLVALLAGAELHVQDYNREVLQSVTIPNVAANWAAWQIRDAARAPAAQQSPEGLAGEPVAAAENAAGGSPPARYFSGDWDGLGNVLEERGLGEAYDMVLSAETIYSLDSMHTLYHCIKRCLKRPGGVAYIAAKSYYFGVGGGTAAFVKLVNGEGLMRAEVVRVLDDGLSNKREIIRLAYS